MVMVSPLLSWIVNWATLNSDLGGNLAPIFPRRCDTLFDVHFARQFWQRIETIHAVMYFAPEAIDAARTAGLRGFWMGYFGFRAAPLGAVSASVVEAAFGWFAPAMVQRVLPDAWTFAEPSALVQARSRAAAEVLRRVEPSVEPTATAVNEQLAAIVAEASPVARPLFAANRGVESMDDPVEQLWQHCTTLREHHGDGHVLALAVEGVGGCEAHRLFLAGSDVDDHVLFDNRGWSGDEWAAAGERLAKRGLLVDGRLSADGRELRQSIEATTDRLAVEPIELALEEGQRDRLLQILTPLAVAVASSGILPFPNPMGLPPLRADTTGG